MVGHSYGGAVVSEAGAHRNVERLVYLSAFALDQSESVAQNALTGGEDTELATVLVFDGETVTVRPDASSRRVKPTRQADAMTCASSDSEPTRS